MMGSLGLGAGDVSGTKRLYSEGNRGMCGGEMNEFCKSRTDAQKHFSTVT